MADVSLPPGNWQEITGDDWTEEETENGDQFDHAIEVRSWNSGGYHSRYYAVLSPPDDGDDD